MALQLDFNICQEACDSLVFTETTGAYSADNTGGWNNASTESIGDVATAVLEITFPDGTELATPLDISATFPTADEDVELVIDSTDVGVTGDFEDGVYIFRYTVTMDDDTEYTKACYIFLSCQADCCVDKLYAKITTTTCKDCSNSKLAFANEAFGYLKAAKSKAGCGDITGATELLEKVQYMCNLERCNC
jgi:hypothetical protein